MDTLVLDVSYRPVATLPWESVIVWVLERFAEVIDEHPDRHIRTVNWQVKMPSVIRLLQPVKKKKAVKFSRYNVYARDRGRCAYCATPVSLKAATYDHVVPRAHRGTTTWENVVIACVSCNQKKGGRTPEQAGMKLLSLPHRPKKLPDAPRQLHLSPGDPESWKGWLRSAVYWNGSLDEG